MPPGRCPITETHQRHRQLQPCVRVQRIPTDGAIEQARGLRELPCLEQSNA
jgi:hypothetical protein